MTFKEYLEYIIKNFKAELNYKWFVEIIEYHSCFDIYRNEFKCWYDYDNYLRITDRHFCFSYTIWSIKELYEANVSVKTAYQYIKETLEKDYIKQLWKND